MKFAVYVNIMIIMMFYMMKKFMVKGAKKKIPETTAIADHLIKQAKAIYVLKDKAIEKLKQ